MCSVRYLFLAVVAVLAIQPPASAQPIRAHGHPQLAAYASPADWLTDSAQCHWTGSGAAPVPTPSPLSSHTHVDLTIPRYGEMAGPTTVPFAVKLHHVTGSIGAVYGQTVRDIIWDATGTSTMPDIVGNPVGDVVVTGHLTIDPNIRVMDADPNIHSDDPPNLGVDLERSPPLHGWFNVTLTAETYFTNGDFTSTLLAEPFYSTRDLTAPERDAPVLVQAQCLGRDTQPFEEDAGRFGVAVAEYDDYLPIAPIQQAWTVPAAMYNYSAGDNLPIGSVEQRLDLDFHHGTPGTVIVSAPLPGDQSSDPPPIVFDPAVMGMGTHKEAVIWTQPSKGEQLSALLVIEVKVGR